MSHLQTFEVALSSNILGHADGTAHEAGNDWCYEWDTSKSYIAPEMFWLPM